MPSLSCKVRENRNNLLYLA